MTIEWIRTIGIATLSLGALGFFILAGYLLAQASLSAVDFIYRTAKVHHDVFRYLMNKKLMDHLLEKHRAPSTDQEAK